MLRLGSLLGKKKEINRSISPAVVLVLDGYGIAPHSQGNAITLAKTPNMDKYAKVYPYNQLIASGESVGLPANEVGNSEVGHLTIGAGRAVSQSLKRINTEIEEGSFYENRAFIKAISHVIKNKSRLHIMGLVSYGSVHSSLKHLNGLIELLRREGIVNAAFHLFTDGRDAPPKEGIEVIKEVKSRLEDGVGKIASVSGRYYAMDRNARWERTQKAYEAITLGKGLYSSDPVQAMQESYDRGDTDEFVKPTIIVKEDKVSTNITKEQSVQQSISNYTPIATVNDNDAVIFFNFRVDRARQLSMAFAMLDFEDIKKIELGNPEDSDDKVEIKKTSTFKREKVVKNLFFTTMTQYKKDLTVSAIAYPPQIAQDCLPEVLSRSGLKQFHLAESEKKRMVDFYFDGMREKPYEGEDVVIVSSPKVATYDKKPEMSVYKLVDEFKKALKKDKYHLFAINFANPDMVAHSGNLEKTIEAVEHVDKAVGEIVEAVLKVNGTVFITADHGNAEELLTFPSASFYFTTSGGEVNTDHSNNPVPIYIVGKKYLNHKLEIIGGALSDIAPSVLHLLNLKTPPVMKGKNLLEYIK
jgi:2,3-bisphosphoglycerate-independent phosphoglycerate mutase